ncbi:protein GRAVITROPIC IN THE LIGHT 1-like [Rutidosis leptorrhynchoides]|uniref:protein GRAVITROPIC IN THE LIGHT 1-like n=1 Tax=Rutidosis leptorrhynchoides TaxID=125765 RepID=UPI003A99AEED
MKRELKRFELEMETEVEVEAKDLNYWYSAVPFNRDPVIKQTVLRSDSANSRNGVGLNYPKKKSEKVSNFSNLIQRVASSCLLTGGRHEEYHPSSEEVVDVINNYPKHHHHRDYSEYEHEDQCGGDDHYEFVEADDQDINKNKVGINNHNNNYKVWEIKVKRVMEMEVLMNEVFDAISSMKIAYISLQEAHSPWDPQRMRIADVSVVGELRRLAMLKERFRRKSIGGDGGRRGSGEAAGGMLKEVVVPYEAAIKELKRMLKSRDIELHTLKQKLSTSSKKGRSQYSRKKVTCIHAQESIAMAPASELFEATMSQVKESLKSFTSLLLSLMRSAHWDIAAAIRSIEVAANATTPIQLFDDYVGIHHAKYALESYISRKIFQGFGHETFYMDGSLSSLLNPDQYRRDCFTQYRDMKAMDPNELLGILPTCHFAKFCSNKYLSIVHPKMEESLFGNLEMRNQVMVGNHPKTQFYGNYLQLAKSIWLLHLLAFSLDPAPSQFEASRGAEFHPHFMESVVKLSGGPAYQVVGFPVIPGFKLGNESIIKATVYVRPRT